MFYRPIVELLITFVRGAVNNDKNNGIRWVIRREESNCVNAELARLRSFALIWFGSSARNRRRCWRSLRAIIINYVQWLSLLSQRVPRASIFTRRFPCSLPPAIRTRTQERLFSGRRKALASCPPLFWPLRQWTKQPRANNAGLFAACSNILDIC